MATTPQVLERDSYVVDTFYSATIHIEIMGKKQFFDDLSSYLQLHLDSINAQDFILEIKARNH